jgi:hypothetical protein
MGREWKAAIDAVLARSTDLAGEVIKAIGGWEKPPVDRSGFSPAVLKAALHFVGTSHSLFAYILIRTPGCLPCGREPKWR